MSWIDDIWAKNIRVAPINLPERFAAAEYRNLPDGILKQCVRDYCANFYKIVDSGIGCLFIGRAGKWKTYAAAVIGRTLNGKPRLDVMFVQCGVTLLEMDRKRFDPETNKTIKEICSASVAIIDDFTQVPERSFAASVLTEIAESRWAAQRPTLWTGNVGAVSGENTERNLIAAIGNLYGAGFARRIWHGSEGYRVNIT